MAAIWSFAGKITTKVDGQGILLRGEAVLDVTASSEGRLIGVDVGVGDIVKAGSRWRGSSSPISSSSCATRPRAGDAARAGRDQVSAVEKINARRRKQLEELHKEAEVLERPDQGRPGDSGAEAHTEAQIAALEQEIANSRVMGAGRTNLVAGVEDEISQLESDAGGSPARCSARTPDGCSS